MTRLRNLLSSSAKRVLHDAGALAAWHRRRNADRLTVIMFHRILSPRDPRWSSADPEYTLSEEHFARCLEFFQRHYHVVSLSQVLSARSGETVLPERPLLITFDDGWTDNVEFALPLLRRAGLPAVMFVAGSAVDRHEPFWQERLVHAFRAGRLDATRAAALSREVGGTATPRELGDRDDLDGLRDVIARMEKLEPSRRAELLLGLESVLSDGVRHMVTPAELRTLHGSGVAIGAHGQSHEPLTRTDAARELVEVRDGLAGHVETAPVLSFPHGRFDERVVEQAFGAGYRLLFTSVPELPRRDARGPGLLGRVGFTTETITDGGRFAPERLALHLFRKPHAA